MVIPFSDLAFIRLLGLAVIQRSHFLYQTRQSFLTIKIRQNLKCFGNNEIIYLKKR